MLKFNDVEEVQLECPHCPPHPLFLLFECLLLQHSFLLDLELCSFLQQSASSVFDETSFLQYCLPELDLHAKELPGINKKPNNKISMM